MSRQPIFIGINGYGVHSKLMSCSEYTDCDFLYCLLKSARSLQRMIGRTPRLATRIFVNGPLCPAAFLRIVWMEWTGVPGALGDPANMGASRGGCNVFVAMVVGVQRRSEQFESRQKCGEEFDQIFSMLKFEAGVLLGDLSWDRRDKERKEMGKDEGWLSVKKGNGGRALKSVPDAGSLRYSLVS